MRTKKTTYENKKPTSENQTDKKNKISGKQRFLKILENVSFARISIPMTGGMEW